MGAGHKAQWTAKGSCTARRFLEVPGRRAALSRCVIAAADAAAISCMRCARTTVLARQCRAGVTSSVDSRGPWSGRCKVVVDISRSHRSEQSRAEQSRAEERCLTCLSSVPLPRTHHHGRCHHHNHNRRTTAARGTSSRIFSSTNRSVLVGPARGSCWLHNDGDAACTPRRTPPRPRHDPHASLRGCETI
ncbi:hypothetical protein EJ04DRAFT_230900 [Polyplosphaeria fusca]|uniref:Uncharacterized protein n=1 Tax=Polyplosphaeria fusca TaxID=682080 RepID=A0A9P4QXM8_9PLEO|nr:hypothetical protein EJ04DRAFT_230900 [Polyplosphaeria fusca]